MALTRKSTVTLAMMLMKEIARRKPGGAAEDCDEDSRQVMNDLTGFACNAVWDATPDKNKNRAALAPGN